eukprot:131779_1
MATTNIIFAIFTLWILYRPSQSWTQVLQKVEDAFSDGVSATESVTGDIFQKAIEPIAMGIDEVEGVFNEVEGVIDDVLNSLTEIENLINYVMNPFESITVDIQVTQFGMTLKECMGDLQSLFGIDELRNIIKTEIIVFLDR